MLLADRSTTSRWAPRSGERSYQVRPIHRRLRPRSTLQREDTGSPGSDLRWVRPRSSHRAYASRRKASAPEIQHRDLNARGASPQPSARTQYDGKASKTMTHRRQDLGARRRGELDRDRGSRRLSQAIDAKRRLNDRRADSPRTKPHPVGPSDPRYGYLTRSYDEHGPDDAAVRISEAHSAFQPH
jgi:hypothetical protein